MIQWSSSLKLIHIEFHPCNTTIFFWCIFLPKGSWKLRPTKGMKGKWVQKTLMASPNFYDLLMCVQLQAPFHHDNAKLICVTKSFWQSHETLVWWVWVRDDKLDVWAIVVILASFLYLSVDKIITIDIQSCFQYMCMWCMHGKKILFTFQHVFEGGNINNLTTAIVQSLM